MSYDLMRSDLVSVDRAIKSFSEELKKYNCSFSYPGGSVVHLSPVGNTGYYLGTFTAYNEQGEKTVNAIPFDKYIKVINEIEGILDPYAFDSNGFTGRVVGWNPTQTIKTFLYQKKVHRLFFLPEHQVLTFLKNYTDSERVRQRKEDLGVDVLVTFG